MNVEFVLDSSGKVVNLRELCLKGLKILFFKREWVSLASKKWKVLKYLKHLGDPLRSRTIKQYLLYADAAFSMIKIHFENKYNC